MLLEGKMRTNKYRFLSLQLQLIDNQWLTKTSEIGVFAN